MYSAALHKDLIDRLPNVRGRLTPNAPLAKFSWFKVGGPAEALFRPADREDLCALLSVLPDDVPVTVLGAASNVIIRDGGIPGLVIRLGGPFARVSVDMDGLTCTAGAGALDMTVAQYCAREGLGGLEFFSGIPGSIGGALLMNAGAYGTETCDVLDVAEAVDRDGQIHRLTVKDLNMTYRHTETPEGYIYISGRFRGERSEPEIVEGRMAEIRAAREGSQPIREMTGGSTFANPSRGHAEDEAAEGRKAWELIDEAGCRGLKIGGAQMSEKHCNFMINTGDATAEDLEKLGEEVRRRVRESAGVELRWEIRRIGLHAPGSVLDEDTPVMGAA